MLPRPLTPLPPPELSLSLSLSEEKGKEKWKAGPPGWGKRSRGRPWAAAHHDSLRSKDKRELGSHSPGFSVLGSMAIFCAEQHLLKTPVLTRPLKLLPHLSSLSL